MKRSEIFFGLLRIPVDFFGTLAALFAAYFLRAQEDLLPAFLKRPDLGNFPPFEAYVRLSLVAALVFLIILSFFRLYSLRVSDSLASEVRKILSASIIWLMAIITYYFVIREFPFSRLVLFYASALLFFFVSIGRIIIKNIQRYLLKRGIGKRRIVFIGENTVTQELTYFFHRSDAFQIVGTTKNMAEFENLFNEKRGIIEEVIQTSDDHKQAEQVINFCREHHLQYHFVPDLLEVHQSNVEIAAIGGIPLISLRETPLDGWGKVLKRIFDIVIASVALILLSPFFLIIAIAIKLDSPGAVFFRFLDDGEKAERIGEKGRPFHCVKFRTMKIGTHALRYTALADRNIRKGPLVKIANDPRITRVGRFLRRFSIDELPQLWNVLRGEMTLVGPRPHLPEEVERYEKHHKFVLTIKPGLTGLAQISGRSDLPFEEEVRLDTYYIENWSLWFDIKILLKTVVVVFNGYRE